MDIKNNNRKSYSDLEAIVIPDSSLSSSYASSSPSTTTTTTTTTTNNGAQNLSAAAARRSYWNEKYLAEPTSSAEPLPTKVSESRKGSSNGFFGGGAADGSALSPIDALPPPAYYLVDSRGQTQALYTVPTNNTSSSSASSDTDSIANFKPGSGYNAAVPPPSGPPGSSWWKSMGQGKRILGLRKNVFLAVCAGLCFLVLGLLLTALFVTRTVPLGGGGGKADGPQPGRPPMFSTIGLLGAPDANDDLLAASNLASMNWTDTATGTSYTGIFYQSSRATGMALMAAIRNDATSAWTSVNITASAGVTQVLQGTPLAAATNNGLWNLIYLNPGFALQEVYATDPLSATGWRQGEMAAKLGNPTVVPSSGVAAMWQSCDACDDALFVMWQDSATMDIVYANETNLTWNAPVTLSTAGAAGSSVAVSAFTDYSGDKGPDKNAVRFYYENGDSLYETMKGPLGAGKLITGNFGKPIAKDLHTNPSPALASMTYGLPATGWTNNLLAYVDPWKGSVTTVGWQGTGWKIAMPSLLDLPDEAEDAGFSAVAFTQSMRAYLMCPSMGEIHEFVVNSTDTTMWQWQTTVKL